MSYLVSFQQKDYYTTTWINSTPFAFVVGAQQKQLTISLHFAHSRSTSGAPYHQQSPSSPSQLPSKHFQLTIDPISNGEHPSLVQSAFIPFYVSSSAATNIQSKTPVKRKKKISFMYILIRKKMSDHHYTSNLYHQHKFQI